MKPAFQIGDIVYVKTDRTQVGQVKGIMQRVRSFEFEVRFASSGPEMFDEYELTKDKSEALAPAEDDD